MSEREGADGPTPDVESGRPGGPSTRYRASASATPAPSPSASASAPAVRSTTSPPTTGPADRSVISRKKASARSARSCSGGAGADEGPPPARAGTLRLTESVDGGLQLLEDPCTTVGGVPSLEAEGALGIRPRRKVPCGVDPPDRRHGVVPFCCRPGPLTALLHLLERLIGRPRQEGSFCSGVEHGRAGQLGHLRTRQRAPPKGLLGPGEFGEAVSHLERVPGLSGGHRLRARRASPPATGAHRPSRHLTRRSGEPAASCPPWTAARRRRTAGRARRRPVPTAGPDRASPADRRGSGSPGRAARPSRCRLRCRRPDRREPGPTGWLPCPAGRPRGRPPRPRGTRGRPTVWSILAMFPIRGARLMWRSCRRGVTASVPPLTGSGPRRKGPWGLGLGPGAWGLGPGAWALGPGAWGLGPGAADVVPRASPLRALPRSGHVPRPRTRLPRPTPGHGRRSRRSGTKVPATGASPTSSWGSKPSMPPAETPVDRRGPSPDGRRRSTAAG